MKHRHWHVSKIDTVFKTKNQKKTRLLTVYTFSFLPFFGGAHEVHITHFAGEAITFTLLLRNLGFAEAPNLHRTRSRHKGTPAKAQGASNAASDFVWCQQKWQMPGVFGCDVWCVKCVCVRCMLLMCVVHVMLSFDGIFLVMCVKCLVMFVPTSAVLRFAWTVREIFVV